MLYQNGREKHERHSLGPGRVRRPEIQETAVTWPQGIFMYKVTEDNGWRAVTAKRQGERVEGRDSYRSSWPQTIVSENQKQKLLKRLTSLIENNTKLEQYPQKELTYFKI